MDWPGHVDPEEDGKYGKGKRGDELPAELARREKRLDLGGEGGAGDGDGEPVDQRVGGLAGNAGDQEKALALVEQSERAMEAEVEETVGDCAYRGGPTR